MKTNLLTPPSLNELIACALVVINQHPTSLHLDGLRRIAAMSIDTDLFSSDRVPRAIAKTVFATPLTTSIPPEDLYPIQKQAAMILGIHHDMPFMQPYKLVDGVTLSDLDKLGWSKHMIKKYLGQPDIISLYGIYYSTYDKARVEKASQIRTLKDALHLVQWQRKEPWSSRYDSQLERRKRLQRRSPDKKPLKNFQLKEPTFELVVHTLQTINPHIPSINPLIVSLIPGLYFAGHLSAMVCLADTAQACHLNLENIADLDFIVSQIYRHDSQLQEYETAAYWHLETNSVLNRFFENIIINHYCNPSSLTQKLKTF